MNNYDEFMLKVKAAFSHVIPREAEDIEIREIEITKINDQKLRGLTFKKKGIDEAPTFYIDEDYRLYEQGVRSPEDIAADLWAMYTATEWMPPMKGSEMSFAYDDIKDDITVRLVCIDKNKDFLADKPYYDHGNGFAFIYDYNVANDYRITLTDALLESVGVGSNTLYAKAIHNTLNNDPPVMRKMEDMLFGDRGYNMLDDDYRPSDKGSMYVLTNKSGMFGAYALGCPEVLEKATRAVGESCYILPSSVHEVILLPKSMSHNVAELQDMVRQANQTVVDAPDILADDVYSYDMNMHILKNESMAMEVEAEEDEEF